MSDADDRALARRADAAARSVEGVLRLYSATPIPARLADRIIHPDEDAPLSIVVRSATAAGIEVTIAVGVTALRSAATTAAAVAAAVRAELAGSGPDAAPVSVHVRVSRVTEP